MYFYMDDVAQRTDDGILTIYKLRHETYYYHDGTEIGCYNPKRDTLYINTDAKRDPSQAEAIDEMLGHHMMVSCVSEYISSAF